MRPLTDEERADADEFLWQHFGCLHPSWTEIGRTKIWTGNGSGEGPPINCPVTVIEQCAVCGAGRQRVLPGGEQ